MKLNRQCFKTVNGFSFAEETTRGVVGCLVLSTNNCCPLTVPWHATEKNFEGHIVEDNIGHGRTGDLGVLRFDEKRKICTCKHGIGFDGQLAFDFCERRKQNGREVSISDDEHF